MTGVNSKALALAKAELARRELARRHMLDFVQLFTPGYQAGWVHREISELLDAFIEAVERKLSPRLMIFLPPRAGKSQLVSRAFPAFALGKHPEWEVVAATYGQDLASDFGRWVRGILNDPIYRGLFPKTTIDPSSNAMDRMDTTAHGGYKAVGVGGALTGRGAHILIVDDPVKDREAADSELQREGTWNWYSSVARTRLAPGGGVIILQTRWHQEDLAGKLLLHAKDNPEADQWHVYEYPALATRDEKHRKTGEALHPERYPVEALKKIRASLLPRDWSALYQQNPVPDEGLFFKRDWLKTYTTEPDPAYYYIGTDFAIGEKQTNDWTVMAAVAIDSDGRLYFTPDLVRARLNGYEIVEQLLDLCKRRKPMQIAIERGHISKAIGPHLTRRMRERRQYHTVWEHTPTKDKQARARSLQARMQQGQVFFHPSLLPLIEEEFLAFPAGRHDDIVDACATVCLMLDDIISPTPAPGLPTEDAIVEGSFDDIKRRSTPPPKRSHRPRSLFRKE